LIPFQGKSLWESSPPLGPRENPTRQAENQEAGRRRRVPRPRMRRCLLKGCEQRFRSRQARQRYCSGECREGARQWARRKAQQRYRATTAGQQKRNGQSRRYRERVKSRKPPEPEAVDEAARVIATEPFFSTMAATGPAATRDRCVRGEVPYNASARRSAGARWSASGNGSGAGNRRALNPEILICRRCAPYIQPVGCNWSFTVRFR